MNIVKSTKRFEKWLRRHSPVVEEDLQLKHRRMAESVFLFFRATFYRWAQLWPNECPELADAPKVLSVGDLHVENFGTWRDIEGRLIWGVNDFDEAWPMAYTNDLVRLAVSAILASEEQHLRIGSKQAAEAIIEGYQEGLLTGGRAFVLGEHHVWLRKIAESALRDPVHFWKKMDSLPGTTAKIPKKALDAIESLLPDRNITCRILRRIAGIGSLGHLRVVAVGEWKGGRIAREVKALTPSACCWAAETRRSPKLQYQDIVNRAVRCIDPFVRLRGRWLVRRLSPHCSRIELEMLDEQADELRLLHSMGWETANIHLGSRKAVRDIERHLRKQAPGWLHVAAKHMTDAVAADWRTWAQSQNA